jgi:hypothetical protein
MRNTTTIALTVTFAATAVLGAQSRSQAGPFVDRPLVLPRAQWALDTGLGVGHLERPSPADDVNGLGFNLELRGGLTEDVQIGLRTGIRVDSEGRATRADQFGRTFDTETYGTGIDTIANPELSLRIAVVRTDAVGLGLEGRVYLPVEDGTKTGVMLALPLHFHLGDRARLESGVYVPIIFTDPTVSVVSFPFHFWLQATDSLALGPLSGVRLHNPGGTITVPLGAGLNYAASQDTDLRAWLLFPNVKGSGSTDYFGVGVGIELRF